MTNLPPQVETAIQKTDEFMAKYPTLTQYEKLKEAEEKFGYSKVYFFLAGITLISAFLYLIGGAKLITDLVSFVYPAYMSFKAIDVDGSSEQITQWLTYWVVFSFISLIEHCFMFITNFIPFYFYLKLALFVWLYHPKFMGAGIVYNQLIRPRVLPYMKVPQKKAA